MKKKMGNNLRCCLSCVLPCGALDVVRVVHRNGHVEVFSRQVTAGEVMAANPNHIVISKPCNLTQGDADVSPRSLIVPPDSDLKRGYIYFLTPGPKPPQPPPPKGVMNENKDRKRRRRSKREMMKGTTGSSTYAKDKEQEDYLKEIVSEKSAAATGGRRHQGRRSSVGRVAVWRPQLESISELD